MPTPSSDPIEAALKAHARELGFDAVGIADAADPWPEGARLREFLAFGRHGEMDWMADTADRRAHPTALWPQARSAVMVGLNYGPSVDPLEALTQTDTAAISVYAQGGDYHDLVKRKLKALARWLAARTDVGVKVFVDTAPLMEKPLAARAGVGWPGKHTNLVSRTSGSWLFLGCVLTEARLAADAPETDHCGACTRCVDVCPTNAFPTPYQLDARRCIAYLTIEHAGPIPREFRAPMGNRVYGCDDCLAVCPWNKFAAVSREAALHPRPQSVGARLVDLAALDETSFRQVFAGSPIKRTGRDRFVRNVAIALGNSADPDAVPAVMRLLDDASALVRGAAIWALGRLDPERWAGERLSRADAEPDPDARAEWAITP